MQTRTLFRALPWLSLLLALACAYVWWRSYHVGTSAGIARGYCVGCDAWQGKLTLEWSYSTYLIADRRNPEALVGTVAGRTEPLSVWFGSSHQPLGAGSQLGGVVEPPMIDMGMPLPLHFSPKDHWVTFAMAWPVIAFSTLPIAALLLGIFRKPRPSFPACTYCGYDLRGHLGDAATAICPECGRTNPPPGSATRAPVFRRLRLVGKWVNAFSLTGAVLCTWLAFTANSFPRQLYAGRNSTFALSAWQNQFVFSYDPGVPAGTEELDHVPRSLFSPDQPHITGRWWDCGLTWYRQILAFPPDFPERDFYWEPFYARSPMWGTMNGDANVRYFRVPAWLMIACLSLLPATSLARLFNRRKTPPADQRGPSP